MNFAVIKISGKQYKVASGLVLEVDKIEGEKGAPIVFSDVLLYGDENGVNIGLPTINGASVKAKIVEQIKGNKIRIAKFKSKVRYRRTTGFRAQLTKIEITDIFLGGKN